MKALRVANDQKYCSEAAGAVSSSSCRPEIDPQVPESTRECIYDELRALACVRGSASGTTLQMREFFDEPVYSSHLGPTRARYLYNVVYVITELVAGGDLLSAVTDRGSLAEEDARAVFRSLMQCCMDLQSRGVLHRDIKLENIMLRDPHDFHKGIKLVDFGLATDINRDGPAEKVCGTPMNVAPEIVAVGLRRSRGEEIAPYGSECDVWSAGVLLYTLLSGSPPFDPIDFSDLYAMILQGSYKYDDPAWQMVTDSAKDLVTRCLTVDPSKRISPIEALDHPWLQCDL